MRQLLLTVALVTFLLGCATFEKNAYHTIGSVTTLVDAAMSAYGDEVKAGKVPQATQDAVKVSYNQYYAAIQVAKDATLSYKSGAVTQSALKSALDAVSASAGSVINLVKAFLPADKQATLTLHPL